MIKLRKVALFVLAIVALITTWPFAFEWIEAGGNILDPISFFKDAINAGSSAAFLSVDMAIAWLVFMLWVLVDSQRIGAGQKVGWIFVGLSYIGVSFAFPIYIIYRERYIDKKNMSKL